MCVCVYTCAHVCVHVCVYARVCVFGFDVKSLCVVEHRTLGKPLAGWSLADTGWQGESLWPLCCLSTGDKEVCAVAAWAGSEAAPGLLGSWPGFHGPLTPCLSKGRGWVVGLLPASWDPEND